jgi:regulator of extracellular matrix RemA (YlzA/DUF370 family)
MKLVNIGFGNAVSARRIVAIVSPESAPIKRLVQDAKEEGRAIDVTGGRKTRAVLVADTGHVIMCALMTETITARLNGTAEPAEADEDETDAP